jgi:hypothetical protein
MGGFALGEGLRPPAHQVLRPPVPSHVSSTTSGQLGNGVSVRTPTPNSTARGGNSRHYSVASTHGDHGQTGKKHGKGHQHGGEDGDGEGGDGGNQNNDFYQGSSNTIVTSSSQSVSVGSGHGHRGHQGRGHK